MKATFDSFRDTKVFERYMLNSYQFSAAKEAATARLIQTEVFDQKGTVRGFRDFERHAKEITQISHETWLRVEYDMCRRQVVQSQAFRQMREDADLYPYWIYRGRMDGRERPEHVALEGLTFLIGDPSGDSMVPPVDWNCRCKSKSADGREVDAGKVLSGDQARVWLEGEDEHGHPYVDPQFRYCAADQGMLPKTGSYFEVMKNANDGNAAIFGLTKDKQGSDIHMVGFASTMHHMLMILEEWRQDFHTDRLGNVVFQNQDLRSNVRFTNNSFHTIKAHPKGFENLPAAVQDPSEVWMSWENPDAQVKVRRNYIKFAERTAYVVQTMEGVITDAVLVSKHGAEKYRKGVPWLKK